MALRARFGVVIPEYCCFECKDSGEDLRVCDYKDCLKTYHPYCTVSKTGLDFPPGDKFICNWHSCVNCRKSSDYQCLCCPNYSVCQNCLGRVQFYKLGDQNKGLCGFCMSLALTIETKAAAADPKKKYYFQDPDVSFLLFNDYWSIIKDTERLTLTDLQAASGKRLTLIDLQAASGLPDSDLCLTCEADSEKYLDEDNETDEYLVGGSDDNGQTFPSGLESEADKKNASVKRKRSNKKTFVGWGTKELIEFLSCIGKDTKEPLDEAEIVRVVKEYIEQRGLFLGDKKRCFECDDKLRPLFTRRKVRYNMLRRKLQMHLAANASLEDESLDGSEGDDDPIRKKKPQTSLELNIAKKVSERHKRCFASLTYNNIKLIYLRRKLVTDLLKNKDTFELKVVGCFVRIMNARSQFFQKSKRPFQLGLVTGIKESQEEYKIKDIPTKVVLCVAGFWEDVKITMLSEEDIQEEECGELIPLVEKGILKRATVAEFEEKVAAVHTDIVNHWIDRELERLENRIEIANEKGWRQEMFELMDRKKLLSTQAERQRLLEMVPEIAVDAEDEKETELTITADNSCQVNRGKKLDSSACLVNMKENSKGVTENAHVAFEVLKEKAPEDATEQEVNAFNILNEETSKAAAKQVAGSSKVREEESPGATKKMRHSYSLNLNEESSKDGSKTQAIDVVKDESNHTKCDKSSNIPIDEVIDLDRTDEEEHGPGHGTVHPPRTMNDGNLHMEQLAPLTFATLRAEEEAMDRYHRESEAINAVGKGLPHHTFLWHYTDPKGKSQGPFLLAKLHEWYMDGFFADDFKVWRSGQTEDQAILFTDAYRMYY